MTLETNAGLALLGGSFDPPHRTHSRIARAALEQLPVSDLWVMPSGDHPHKGGQEMAEPRHRLAMCQLAFEEMPNVFVTDLEINREGVSYTVDTLARIGAKVPARPLYFLIGADNLALLPTWRDHHRILELTAVVTFPRRGYPIDEKALEGLDFTADERDALFQRVLDLEPDDVSSTTIRDCVRAGARHLPELEPRVERYIVEHCLYST